MNDELIEFIITFGEAPPLFDSPNICSVFTMQQRLLDKPGTPLCQVNLWDDIPGRYWHLND